MGLPRKKKKCKECGNDRVIWARGMCKTCAVLNKPISKKGKKSKKDSVPLLKKRARYWFQRWIRYRDVGSKCICESCPNVLNDIKVFDAGHYHKAELYSNVIFDEDNVHGQCKGCNGFRDGNIIEYRKGLIKKIGEERLLELENKALYNREVYKWDREFLLEIIDKYKSLIQEIEQNQN